jgi:predicted glutamine amidotransferase
VCEVLAVAWPEPEPFDRVLSWALEMERLGVAGFGWGVAWLDGDGLVRLNKHPGKLAEDAAGQESVRNVRSTRFLVHLRRPSRLSTIQVADTQPFVRDDGAFAFCHNGFLSRAEEERRRFAGRLHGQADSEVGFRFFESLIAGGESPGGALVQTHESMGGRANFGYLAANGALLVYANHSGNPVWRFRAKGADVAASALHSFDRSLFDLLFRDATDAQELERGTVTAVGAPGDTADPGGG